MKTAARKAPKSSKAKPKAAKAKPKAAKPKPKPAVKAKPKASQAVAKPKPVAKAKAKPVAAKPKPVAAKPKPVVASKPVAKPAVVKPTVAKAVPAKAKPHRSAPPRADYGAPIDDFFSKQAPALRPILDALRALVDEVVPNAHSSIKWGMPFYTLNGSMMCALGAHAAHVNLILAGAADAFVDPDGRLSGDGRGSRHLKVTTLDDLPRAQIRKWLATAAAIASKRS